MSDAQLVPGWSNRGSVPAVDDAEDAEAKRVEVETVEDKAVKRTSTRKK